MNKFILFALVLLAAGCKEKFESPAPAVITGFLVIEGVINNGGGVSNVKLSRTTSLNNNLNILEKGAVVKLEDSNASSLQLLETSEGNYTISNLNLDPAMKYRLNVQTGNNEAYLSDFASVNKTPPIDSVNWVRESKGVQLYINTHDPLNNTKYYQWEFDETWEFHSAYGAALKYIKDPSTNNNIGVTSTTAADPNIYNCWQFNPSKTLLIGSSAKLSQDIIHLPLTHIPAASWKLSVLYSILVKQYSWSKEGYEFLERMKKNTESLGSVFDAQPSEINGNIRCVSNPQQPVIGFFNICTIREQRIFIRNIDLPGWGYTSGCSLREIENNPDSISRKAGGLLPTTIEKGSPFNIISFNAAESACVDCTISGTNVKPTYWP